MVCTDRASTATENSRTPWAKPDYSLKGPWAFRAKEKVICLCEGSKFCTRENPARQRGGNAITGLHASWVGDMVLAMARPWQENVVKCKMVEAFVKANVGMILNLQEVGEHESCGPGNLAHTGFSYDPESFTSACIGFYNFSWQDMGVPDLDRMMDIVQVMEYVANTEGRKIAVHCHAGLGRTGLAIACWFVFTKSHSADSAITTVRQYRQGALQTSAQVLFVSVFEQYVAYLRCVFGGALNMKPLKSGSSMALSEDLHKAPTTEGLPPQPPGARSSSLSETQSRSQSPACASQGQQDVKSKSRLLSRSGSFSGTCSRLNSPAPASRAQQDSKTKGRSLSHSGSFSGTMAGLVKSFTGRSRCNRVSASGDDKKEKGKNSDPVDVKMQGGMRVETYDCGLTIVKPVKRSGGSEASEASSSGAGDRGARSSDTAAPTSLINDHDVGLDRKGLPWNSHFHINAQMQQRRVKCHIRKQAVIILIDDFFSSFKSYKSSLSSSALGSIACEYSKLPFDTQPVPDQPEQYTWAKQFLSPFTPSDIELVLLLSALMRHVVKASGGAGCEEAMVVIGRFLVKNDVAYGALILVKQKRGARGGSSAPTPKVAHVAVAVREPMSEADISAMQAPPHPLGALLSPGSESKAMPVHLVHSTVLPDGEEIQPPRRPWSGSYASAASPSQVQTQSLLRPSLDTALKRDEPTPPPVAPTAAAAQKESQEQSPPATQPEAPPTGPQTSQPATPTSEPRPTAQHSPSPAKSSPSPTRDLESPGKQTAKGSQAKPAAPVYAKPTSVGKILIPSQPLSVSHDLDQSTSSMPSPAGSQTGRPQSRPGHRSVVYTAQKLVATPQKSKYHLPPLPKGKSSSGGAAPSSDASDPNQMKKASDPLDDGASFKIINPMVIGGRLGFNPDGVLVNGNYSKLPRKTSEPERKVFTCYRSLGTPSRLTTQSHMQHAVVNTPSQANTSSQHSKPSQVSPQSTSTPDIGVAGGEGAHVRLQPGASSQPWATLGLRAACEGQIGLSRGSSLPVAGQGRVATAGETQKAGLQPRTSLKPWVAPGRRVPGEGQIERLRGSLQPIRGQGKPAVGETQSDSLLPCTSSQPARGPGRTGKTGRPGRPRKAAASEGQMGGSRDNSQPGGRHGRVATADETQKAGLQPCPSLEPWVGPDRPVAPANGQEHANKKESDVSGTASADLSHVRCSPSEREMSPSATAETQREKNNAVCQKDHSTIDGRSLPIAADLNGPPKDHNSPHGASQRELSPGATAKTLSENNCTTKEGQAFQTDCAAKEGQTFQTDCAAEEEQTFQTDRTAKEGQALQTDRATKEGEVFEEDHPMIDDHTHPTTADLCDPRKDHNGLHGLSHLNAADRGCSLPHPICSPPSSRPKTADLSHAPIGNSVPRRESHPIAADPGCSLPPPSRSPPSSQPTTVDLCDPPKDYSGLHGLSHPTAADPACSLQPPSCRPPCPRPNPADRSHVPIDLSVPCRESHPTAADPTCSIQPPSRSPPCARPNPADISHVPIDRSVPCQESHPTAADPSCVFPPPSHSLPCTSPTSSSPTRQTPPATSHPDWMVLGMRWKAGSERHKHSVSVAPSIKVVETIASKADHDGHDGSKWADRINYSGSDQGDHSFSSTPSIKAMMSASQAEFYDRDDSKWDHHMNSSGTNRGDHSASVAPSIKSMQNASKADHDERDDSKWAHHVNSNRGDHSISVAPSMAMKTASRSDHNACDDGWMKQPAHPRTTPPSLPQLVVDSQQQAHARSSPPSPPRLVRDGRPQSHSSSNPTLPPTLVMGGTQPTHLRTTPPSSRRLDGDGNQAPDPPTTPASPPRVVRNIKQQFYSPTIQICGHKRNAISSMDQYPQLGALNRMDHHPISGIVQKRDSTNTVHHPSYSGFDGEEPHAPGLVRLTQRCTSEISRYPQLDALSNMDHHPSSGLGQMRDSTHSVQHPRYSGFDREEPATPRLDRLTQHRTSHYPQLGALSSMGHHPSSGLEQKRDSTNRAQHPSSHGFNGEEPLAPRLARLTQRCTSKMSQYPQLDAILKRVAEANTGSGDGRAFPPASGESSQLPSLSSPFATTQAQRSHLPAKHSQLPLLSSAEAGDHTSKQHPRSSGIDGEDYLSPRLHRLTQLQEYEPHELPDCSTQRPYHPLMLSQRPPLSSPDARDGPNRFNDEEPLARRLVRLTQRTQHPLKLSQLPPLSSRGSSITNKLSQLPPLTSADESPRTQGSHLATKLSQLPPLSSADATNLRQGPHLSSPPSLPFRPILQTVPSTFQADPSPVNTAFYKRVKLDMPQTGYKRGRDDGSGGGRLDDGGGGGRQDDGGGGVKLEGEAIRGGGWGETMSGGRSVSDRGGGVTGGGGETMPGGRSVSDRGGGVTGGGGETMPGGRSVSDRGGGVTGGGDETMPGGRLVSDRGGGVTGGGGETIPGGRSVSDRGGGVICGGGETMPGGRLVSDRGGGVTCGGGGSKLGGGSISGTAGGETKEVADDAYLIKRWQQSLQQRMQVHYPKTVSSQALVMKLWQSQLQQQKAQDQDREHHQRQKQGHKRQRQVQTWQGKDYSLSKKVVDAIAPWTSAAAVTTAAPSATTNSCAAAATAAPSTAAYTAAPGHNADHSTPRQVQPRTVPVLAMAPGFAAAPARSAGHFIPNRVQPGTCQHHPSRGDTLSGGQPYNELDALSHGHYGSNQPPARGQAHPSHQAQASRPRPQPPGDQAQGQAHSSHPRSQGQANWIMHKAASRSQRSRSPSMVVHAKPGVDAVAVACDADVCIDAVYSTAVASGTNIPALLSLTSPASTSMLASPSASLPVQVGKSDNGAASSSKVACPPHVAHTPVRSAEFETPSPPPVACTQVESPERERAYSPPAARGACDPPVAPTLAAHIQVGYTEHTAASLAPVARMQVRSTEYETPSPPPVACIQMGFTNGVATPTVARLQVESTEHEAASALMQLLASTSEPLCDTQQDASLLSSQSGMPHHASKSAMASRSSMLHPASRPRSLLASKSSIQHRAAKSVLASKSRMRGPAPKSTRMWELVMAAESGALVAGSSGSRHKVGVKTRGGVQSRRQEHSNISIPQPQSGASGLRARLQRRVKRRL
eukprot:gene4014-14093_t